MRALSLNLSAALDCISRWNVKDSRFMVSPTQLLPEYYIGMGQDPQVNATFPSNWHL
jgi:hypothetical protein